MTGDKVNNLRPWITLTLTRGSYRNSVEAGNSFHQHAPFIFTSYEIENESSRSRKVIRSENITTLIWNSGLRSILHWTIFIVRISF